MQSLSFHIQTIRTAKWIFCVTIRTVPFWHLVNYLTVKWLRDILSAYPVSEKVITMPRYPGTLPYLSTGVLALEGG